MSNSRLSWHKVSARVSSCRQSLAITDRPRIKQLSWHKVSACVSSCRQNLAITDRPRHESTPRYETSVRSVREVSSPGASDFSSTALTELRHHRQGRNSRGTRVSTSRPVARKMCLTRHTRKACSVRLKCKLRNLGAGGKRLIETAITSIDEEHRHRKDRPIWAPGKLSHFVKVAAQAQLNAARAKARFAETAETARTRRGSSNSKPLRSTRGENSTTAERLPLLASMRPMEPSGNGPGSEPSLRRHTSKHAH